MAAPAQPPPDPAQRYRRVAAEVHAQALRTTERRHALGKLTAHERIAGLLDPGSFTETGALARHRSSAFDLPAHRPLGDGVVTGFGTVDGRPVCVYAQDFAAFGGSLGEVGGQKIVAVTELALRTGCPIVGINDGGGARIQEGVAALAQYGEIFRRNVAASGVIPQLSLIMGPCAGGAVYSPAITDFTVMVDRGSHMFVTGPDVVTAATGEQVGFEELGGGRTHGERSGVAHHVAATESDALAYAAALLSYLPSNNLDDPPVWEPGTEPDQTRLDAIVPSAASMPYDMYAVIETLLDGGGFLEVHALFAPHVLVGFGRIDGAPVGVVANQPLRAAGMLDIDAAEKAARFVRTCDAFGIPVLTLVDVPGFLPGTAQEWNGIIRRGAKLIYAYAEATVPKLTVITRKAFGGAYLVMGSKHLGADLNLAWPTAQIAVMGAHGAVNILNRRELAAAPDPAALRAKLVREYDETLVHPYVAAERGYVDAVVRPAQTRRYLRAALRQLRGKREAAPAKRHGNIPL